MPYRKTKIVCTIGPSSDSYEDLERLAEQGMAIARLNISHGNHEWHRSIIEHVRELNAKNDYAIATMLDTKGPEVRSGDLTDDLFITKGETFTFTVRKKAEYRKHTTEVSYDGFIEDVHEGDIILIDGGMLSFKVKEKTDQDIICECVDGGLLTSRRHLNIRGKSARLPSITQKDWEDITFGIEEEVDYIALSFVKDAESIHELRKFLKEKKSSIGIIAKIESAASIPHIDEIIKASDGVMVARGDLGSELPFEEVPIIQEEIVRKSREYGKPVIVATHLLESMIVHPTPTRAEVTDIAQAVREYADAIMLSGETATGKHPFKALEVMGTVAHHIETSLKGQKVIIPDSADAREQIVMCAALMGNNLNVDAILVFTRSGYMPASLSRCRPKRPICSFADTAKIRRKLNLYWGVQSFQIAFSENPEETIQRAIAQLKKAEIIKKGSPIVLVSDVLVGEKPVDTVQYRVVE